MHEHNFVTTIRNSCRGRCVANGIDAAANVPDLPEQRFARSDLLKFAWTSEVFATSSKMRFTKYRCLRVFP
jgi:hypothetical protein